MSRKRIDNELRNKVLAFHGEECFYCGYKPSRKKITMDHVVPVCKGGSNNLENLVPACNRCNNDKGSMSADEFVEILKEREYAL